jgi:hypothetical protein
MAQAPSSRRLGLTRDQLASFLTDHEQIKQFESLFDTVDTEVSGGLVTEANTLAGTAYAVGNEALAGVAALNELVAPLVTAPPPTGGTVTSVAASGGTTGMTFSGSPITTSGTLTLGGTLGFANGGTGLTATPANGQLLIGNSAGYTLSTLTAGTAISISNASGSITITNTLPDQVVSLTGAGTTVVTGTYPSFTITSSDQFTGTVTSVAASGGTTGLTFSGSPITTSGTLTLGGTLGVANGGTGATTLTSGYLLKGNGTSAVSASVVYDNGTNVGIGTTSPSALLQISRNGGGDIGALVTQTNSGNGTTARYRATHGSGAEVNLEAGNNYTAIKATSNDYLGLFTNNLERFRIGAAGQFGIGGATYGSAGQVFTSGGASAAPTWTTPTTGTVTSVSGTGTVNGITLTGTVTSSGSLTLGGTLSGVSLTSQVSGTLPVGNGGTGTATTFTSGSVVFAGSSGVYGQDNSNFFWDDTNNRLGIGTASPAANIDSRGVVSIGGAADASLHISQVYGGNGRLSQMSVNSNSTDALNIVASKDGGGTDQWFSYGVTSGYNFFIQSGVGSGSSGLVITSGNSVLVNESSPSAASLVHNFEVNGDIMSTGPVAGLFWANRQAAPSSGANWYGWYTASGTIYLYNPAAGNIASINASTGAYTALSDAAKKKDFEPSSIGLDAVMALKPTLFRMETDDAEAPKQLGFIAQEVKDHIPQAYVEEQNVDAVGNESVYIGLNDRPIIAALVKAVQELTARVAELEGK